MEGKKLKFPNDIIAGLIGAIAIIPDGMASGVMARLSPVNGVYSAVSGLIIGSWTSNSVYMSITTTSALALATGSALQAFPENQKLAGVVTLTIFTGILQVLMGMLKMGFLVRFVSNAVMRGLLSGIAILIVLSQIADLTGNYQKEFEHKVLNSWYALLDYQNYNLYTIGVALATMLLIILIEKTRFKNYAIFISLVVVTVLITILTIPEIKIVGDDFTIPTSLPKLNIPQIDLLPGLFFSSFAISLIGFIQSVGVSHMVTNPSGDYPQDSKDLLGQGITNIGAGMLSGFPVGGSLAQTSLIVKAGAQSRWTNFLSGIFAGLLVMLLSKTIELIPMACFAAILILTGINTIKLPEIRLIWQTGWQSRLVMIFTFLATMAVSVQLAVLISMVVTFILHVVRSSNKVFVRAVVREGNKLAETDIPLKLEPDTVLSIQPYGSLFFAGAIVLRDLLPETEHANRSVVIINMRGRSEIGSSFIKVIKKYSESLDAKNSKMMLIEVSDSVFEQLKRTQILDYMGKEDIIKENRILGEALNKAWDEAEKWIKNKKS